MKLIKSVKTYNVPIEKSSNDRFVEDVDNKLTKFLIEDLGEPSKTNNRISWAFQSTTKADFTITGKKANYIRLESDLFETKKVTYWFLTSVKSISSRKAFTYSAVLDTVATFGSDVFTQLNGKTIEIERFHGDRYTDVKGTLTINSQHHALVNSDFKISDTKGSKIVSTGTESNTNPSDILNYIKIWKEGDTIHQEKYVDQTINHTYEGIRINGILYYRYAILSGPSLRHYLQSDTEWADIATESGMISFYLADNNKQYGDYYIVPITHLIGYTSKKDEYNTIEWLQNLPDGIVLSIEDLPAPINYKSFAQKVISPDTNLDDYHGIWISGKTYKNIKLLPIADLSFVHKVNFDKTQIPAFMGIKNTLTALPKEEEVSIGLLNQDISNITLGQGSEEIEIDVFNFMNKQDNYIKFIEQLTPNGIVIGMEVSEHQYVKYNQTNDLTFFTNRGKTYLAENRSHIEAQKRLIDLQKVKENLSERKQRIQNIGGGGIMGGLLSAINPVNWVTGFGENSTSSIIDTNNDIAKARKHEIDAHIADLSSAPSTINMAKNNSSSIYLNREVGLRHTWTMKALRPNEILLKKIIEYYKAFATPFKSWTTFSDAIWKNMETFNYLKLPRLRDYISDTIDIDTDIVEDLTKDFEAGIRIWHKDVVNMTERNLEKAIVTKFAPRKK